MHKTSAFGQTRYCNQVDCEISSNFNESTHRLSYQLDCCFFPFFLWALTPSNPTTILLDPLPLLKTATPRRPDRRLLEPTRLDVVLPNGRNAAVRVALRPGLQRHHVV